MATPPTLPSLPGLTWSRHKKPGWSTRIATHASGREVRVPLMAYPLYEFESVYSGLISSGSAGNPWSPAFSSAFGPAGGGLSGLGAQSLQTLMGFFNLMQGQYNTFLYPDPDDNTVTGQVFATANGSTTAFTIMRTLGGALEPVGWVTALINVYLGGAIVPAPRYALTTPNTLTFANPPPAGAAISADFAYAFNCRFLSDQMDFEEFMASLYKLDSMKFRSVKSWLGS